MQRLLIMLVCGFLTQSWVFAESYYSLGTANERLGSGFESTVHRPVESCLDGDYVFQGGSQGALNYSGSFDSNTLISNLSGSVKGGINLVIFGGSVKFSMRKKVTENRNSTGSVMRLNYIKGNYTFENRKTKPEILQLLATNPNLVRQRCGDGFIHNVNLGSNLYISAKLHFRSKEKYEWYQTKVKIKIAFWSKTKTKTKESLSATKDAVFSVRVNTDGGLTPTMQELTKDGVMYCTTDNLDPCYDYINSLFTYVFDGGSYMTELTEDHLNVVSYDVESYERSGHYDLAYAGIPSLPKRYVALSERLRAYQDLVSDELENLYAFRAVSQDPNEIVQLDADIARHLHQQTELNDSADYCATLPGTVLCEQRMEAAIALGRS